jgi:hypothetical protein
MWLCVRVVLRAGAAPAADAAQLQVRGCAGLRKYRFMWLCVCVLVLGPRPRLSLPSFRCVGARVCEKQTYYCMRLCVACLDAGAPPAAEPAQLQVGGCAKHF